MLLCILILKFLLAEADEKTSRYFERIYNVNPDGQPLFLVKNSVSTKLRCASLCSVQNGCDCISYIYNNTTQMCMMYSVKLASSTGIAVAYVDRSDYCFPPTIPRASLTRGYTTDGTMATYSCDQPDLYKANGNPVATCRWTGRWMNDFQCVAKDTLEAMKDKLLGVFVTAVNKTEETET